MQGVSNTLERDTPFPDTTTREKVRINVCRPTYDFWARSSNVLTSGIRCLSVRTLKTSVYSASTENVQPLYQHIFVPVEPFTTALGLLNSATFHDRQCPCVRWFRRRTFSAFFFVNCDLINNKNSTFVKLKRRTINVLRQLYITYWIDVQPNQTRKPPICGPTFIRNFFFVLMSIT